MARQKKEINIHGQKENQTGLRKKIDLDAIAYTQTEDKMQRISGEESSRIDGA
jgi:hypothetical protein